MAALDVVVQFIGDTGKLQSDLKQVEGTTSKVGGAFKGMARTVTGALAGIGLASFAQDSIKAAADMGESQSKLAAVFGTATRDIRKHLDGLVANTLGSTKLAVDAAGSFGNMFTQMGLAGDQAITFSKGMLTLTADLVSFHNADPTAVVQAIGAAFRGEYDSVQQWIPTINAAAVEQKALATTGKDSADQLTAGERAAATYALMMEGAGKATGDAARTSDSAANQSRKLHRQFEDISVQVGTALLPILQTLAPIISDVAKAFAEADKSVLLATITFAAFAAVALTIGGPIGAIVAGLGLIIAVAYLVWTNWDQIWTWIKDHPAYAAIIAVLAAPIAWFVLIIGGLKTLWENWDRIWAWIKQAAVDAWNGIKGAWDEVTGFFAGIPGAIERALGRLWEIITQPFRDAWDTIKGVASDIKGAFDEAIGFVRGIWNAFARRWNGIQIRIPSIDIPLVGEIGGGTVGLPDLPILASGGIVRRATLALVGEAGPEAVVPLDRFAASNRFEITVNVSPGVSPAEVGAATVDAIRQYERVAGKAWRAS